MIKGREIDYAVHNVVVIVMALILRGHGFGWETPGAITSVLIYFGTTLPVRNSAGTPKLFPDSPH